MVETYETAVNDMVECLTANIRTLQRKLRQEAKKHSSNTIFVRYMEVEMNALTGIRKNIKNIIKRIEKND